MAKRITVASGKGGVGKSMIASALAVLFAKRNNVVAIDCDVDAPNLAIWLGIDSSNPGLSEVSKEISTIEKPKIDQSRCTGCGICIENCQFKALVLGDKKKAELVPYRCEGCGLCAFICPEKAIKLQPVMNCILQVFKSEFEFPVVQGQIKPGEAESGEAVTEIRNYASSLGKDDAIFIQDAAAGIGCPVIASIVGSDFVVAVAEPSMSSFSDLKRVIQVVDQFRVSWGVVINKFDLNADVTKSISSFAGERLLGMIGYDQKIIKSVVNLKPVMTTDLKVKKEMRSIFQNLEYKAKAELKR